MRSFEAQFQTHADPLARGLDLISHLAHEHYVWAGLKTLLILHQLPLGLGWTLLIDPSNDYGEDWLGKHYAQHHPSMAEAIQNARRRAAST